MKITLLILFLSLTPSIIPAQPYIFFDNEFDDVTLNSEEKPSEEGSLKTQTSLSKLPMMQPSHIKNTATSSLENAVIVATLLTQQENKSSQCIKNSRAGCSLCIESTIGTPLCLLGGLITLGCCCYAPTELCCPNNINYQQLALLFPRNILRFGWLCLKGSTTCCYCCGYLLDETSNDETIYNKIIRDVSTALWVNKQPHKIFEF